MSLQAFKGKRVLITGHTGFKGSWLGRVLSRMDASVFGLALSPADESLYSKLRLPSVVEERIMDINDFHSVSRWVKEIQPEFIFHMAAQPLVIESYKNPRTTFETNVMGSINLFEAVRLAELQCSIVAVTTDKVYKNLERASGYAESDALGGLDPYSASKSAMEMGIVAWRKLFEVNSQTQIVSVRSGNVIGGGDFAENRLIPDILRALSSGNPVGIRNPNSLRPWQHVLDPLFGYMQAAVKMHTSKMNSESYNFGPGESSRLTVGQIAELSISYWPFPNQGWVASDVVNSDMPETEKLWLNSELARTELGWFNLLDAKDSIRWTIDWTLQANEKGADYATDSQIDSYLEMKLT